MPTPAYLLENYGLFFPLKPAYGLQYLHRPFVVMRVCTVEEADRLFTAGEMATMPWLDGRIATGGPDE